MAQQQDPAQRTEKATPERRRKAREEGQFARGRDAGGVAATVGVLIALAALGSGMADRARAYAAHCFREPFDIVRGQVDEAIAGAGGVLTVLVVPACAAAAIAAMAVGFAQAGYHPRFELVLPRWSRLDPMQRLRSMLSPGGAAAEAVLSVARVAVVGWVAWATVRDSFPTLTRLARSGFLGAAGELVDAASRLTLRASAALAILVAADWVRNRLRLEKDLRMSRQELKEELRQHEGDPRVKARLRAKARERIKKGLGKQVRAADVVVTNPTHVAVALRYRPRDGAPVMSARGYDEVALYMREIAREASVPVVESPALARALAARVRVGRAIPVDLYAAVAQVLAYVYRLKGRVPFGA